MTTLGELKVRCVKKTQMDDRTEFSSTTLDNYKNDPEYQDYLNNVLDCINDGIQNLVAHERVPFKKFEIDNTGKTISRIDLSLLSITDLKSIQALYYESDNGVRERVNYIGLLDSIELEDRYEGGRFILIYSPYIRLLTKDDSDSMELSEIGLQELHCSYLVYYSRYELYRKVEEYNTERASWKAAMDQYFEALKQEIYLPRQKRVKCVVNL